MTNKSMGDQCSTELHDATIERINTYYSEFIKHNDLAPEPLWTPSTVYRKQRRDIAKRRVLAAAGVHSLNAMRVLEVGCGQGDNIADYLSWGAPVEAISAVDLLADYIPMARRRFPGLDVRQASVHDLPFEAATFDVIGQSTVFSSLQELPLMHKAAAELRRVLKPGGVILWYDFRYRNPSNNNVKAVTAPMIRALFPDAEINIRTSTLAPPIAKRLAPLSFAACIALEGLPFLRGHIAATIIPNSRENCASQIMLSKQTSAK